MGIERYLPHSGAMVLLDKVLKYDESSVQTSLEIRADNAFLNEQNEFELFNAIELMAQSVGVLRGISNEKESDKLGFLLSARGFKIYQNSVKIGVNLSINCKMSMQDESGFGLYDCEIFDGENLLANATISLLNPSDEMLERIMA